VSAQAPRVPVSEAWEIIPGIAADLSTGWDAGERASYGSEPGERRLSGLYSRGEATFAFAAFLPR
jgi:hypothetical protein